MYVRDVCARAHNFEIIILWFNCDSIYGRWEASHIEVDIELFSRIISLYMVAEKLLIFFWLNYFREFYKLENYSNYNKPRSLEITPNKLIKSI